MTAILGRPLCLIRSRDFSCTSTAVVLMFVAAGLLAPQFVPSVQIGTNKFGGDAKEHYVGTEAVGWPVTLHWRLVLLGKVSAGPPDRLQRKHVYPWNRSGDRSFEGSQFRIGINTATGLIMLWLTGAVCERILRRGGRHP